MKEPIYTAATVPLHETGVALFVGEEAIELMARRDFQIEWDVLYHSCPWATEFQSRAFVTTWFHVYRQEYLPIVVKGGEGGSSSGILAMTLLLEGLERTNLRNSKGRIVGAGQYEAEYQTWIAEETSSDTFIQAALSLIMETFPKCDIHFRYLPPNIPIAWTSGTARWRDQLVIQAVKRPLMHMEDLKQTRLTQKSEFRNKLNRLKKAGDLCYEHVTDKAYFEAILPELIVQYDFRQGAMFNKNQFRNSPIRSRFLVAMFEEGLLHVSILKLSNKVIASIVAVAGRKWVYLGGINTHEPFQAQYYSPGFVLFVMLGHQLAQQGYSTFDLTPGGDAYKERLATSHDQVYEMVLTNSRLRWSKRLLRNSLHTRLIKTGIRPMSMELSIRRKIYLLKHRLKALRLAVLASTLSDFLRHPKNRNEAAHEIPLKEQVQISISISCNSLSDLLEYEGVGRGQSRWEFLADAMRRLEAGERCYTWSGQGRLLACAWLRSPKGGASAVLEGVYCHSSAREALPAFLQAAAAKVKAEQNLDPVYALAGNAL